MAQLIGVVSKVVGSVVALAADGSRRTLLEGDQVFAGEQVQTGDSGAVAIRLENGNELTLGRDSNLALSPQTLATDAVPHADTPGEQNPPSASLLTDVERIQQAIAAGQDPSVDADPTAAGATPAAATGTSAGGGHSFVLLDAVGATVTPTVGLATASTTASTATTPTTSAFFVSSLLAVDSPVTFPVINTLRFNESSLPDGSNPGATTLRGTGSFTISAPDGLTNLSVAGTNVLVNGNPVGLNQTITTALGNSIVITGLNSSTGAVNYAYTLNGAESHANGGGANNLAESIALVGGDRNGSVGNGAIVINIRDDVPTAVDDFNDDGVDEVIRTTTGNVLDNDIQGADRLANGPVAAGTFTGQYGSLALAADGSYTYTINPNAPAFIALGNGGSGSESFTYTLRDADGDSSTATLEIDVNNADNLTISATGVTVNEANLALGSAPNAAALVKTGSFTVDSSAGLSDLSINGVDILSDGVRVGVGQTITTASGDTLVVTGLNTTTGLVNYRFTLVNPETHESGGGANGSVLPLSIVAGDNNGNATSSSLIVTVIDDVPRAIADSNSNVATSSSLTLTGNVLSNDLQGVDRIDSGPISAGTFTGTYGNLVLAANGAYTYTLNPNDADFRALAAGARGTESFTYTLNDADDDTSTATLTLNVVGTGTGTVTPPGTVTITPTGSALVLNEANLALGSAPNAAALTQSGSFNVAASGGLNNLSINGVTVLSNGQLVGLNQTIDTRLGNTLKVTGLDASTGVVTYSYTLNSSETHAAGNGANSLGDALNVVASDRGGVSATAAINVGISDDLPRAVADGNSGTASQSSLTLTGNVLSNDVQGADRIANGPVTPGTLAGTYGNLQLNANGSYTYTLNTADPDYLALAAGSRGSETFVYTLNDADGDTSSATLTLNVAGAAVVVPPAPGTVVITPTGTAPLLNEANLGLGSSPNAAALTKTGTFTVAASNGLANLSINGVAILVNGRLVALNQDIATPLGSTLRVTDLDALSGKVAYTYTLNDREAHASAGGTNTLTETLNVVASDGNGVSATAPISVNILDDVPRAVADSNSGTASQSSLTLTGNVLSNDVQGADRIANGPVTPGTLAGTYGNLQLNANGSYTYTLNTADPDYRALAAGSRGSETFVYTLSDADGDTSSAALTLNVAGAAVVVPPTPGTVVITPTGSAPLLNEANLGLGSSPNAAALTKTGTFTVNASNGLANLSINGVAILVNGTLVALNQDIATPLGSTLRVTDLDALSGKVAYTYTLNDREAHASAGGANTLTEALSVVASDGNGVSATAPISVNILDDVPRAVADSNGASASQNSLTLTGNVLSNDVQGADRIASGPINAGTFAGTYGNLQLNADGSYTYTLNTSDPDYRALAAGARGTESFLYTLKDADGDTSSATLTLNVTGAAVVVPPTPGTVVITPTGSAPLLNEANLALGSSPNAGALTKTGTFTVAASNGLANLSINGVAILVNGRLVALNQDIATPLGSTLRVTDLDALSGKVAYTYTLNDREAHASAGGANTLTEALSVVASDGNGVSATAPISINILDDVPRAVADSNSGTASQSSLTLTGNVLSNDVQGADRIANGPISATTLVGKYGTLQLGADGSYTYTLNTGSAGYTALAIGARGTESFTYTLNDADRDTSTATLTLNVNGPTGSASIVGIGSAAGDVTLNEANLALGSAPSNGALTQSGTFTVNSTGGLYNLSIAGKVVFSNGTLVNYGAPITTESGNTLRITGLNASNGVVTYTYTLNANENHPAGLGANQLTENLAVVASDRNGASASSNIVVKVTDDAPRAVNDSNATAADGSHLTLTGNVLSNDVQGADRIAGGPINAGTLAGKYGSLQLAADGSYTYTLNTASSGYSGLGPNGRGSESFTYTLRDADGDSATAQLLINVAGPAPTGKATIVGIGSATGDVTLNEANLALGSAPSNSALTQSGTFTVNSTGGLYNLSIAGKVVLSNGTLVNYGAPITTESGNTLRITGLNASNGVVTYTYTLVANENHPAGLGANQLTENLAVVASDRNGASASSNIVVKVTDDAPRAVNDSNATNADGSHLTLTGNVLSNDVQGADRIAGGPINAGTLAGKYGSLQLAADGSYTYTLNTASSGYSGLGPNGRGSESFTYTLRDADGDSATAQLSINVVGPAPTGSASIVGIGSATGDVTLNEANLAQGSAPNNGALTQSGAFTVNSTGGLYNLSIAGKVVLSNGTLINYGAPITTESGNTLRITGLNASNGVVTYTYTLAANENHPAGLGANQLTENLAVVASDRNGASASSNIVVKVTDDAPRAVNDSNASTANSSHLTLTGNVLDNDTQGADRVSGGPVVGGTFTGTYGTLVLGANGAYTYTLNTNDADFKALASGQKANETFNYSLRDSDGDTSSAQLQLQIGGGAGNVVTFMRLAMAPQGGTSAASNDFTASTLQTIALNGAGTQLGTSLKTLQRAEFTALSGGMAASLLVAGVLAANSAAAQAHDNLAVALKQGETLTLDTAASAAQVTFQVQGADGSLQTLAADQHFTATQDGTYVVQVLNASSASAAQNYTLALTIGPTTAIHSADTATGTATDAHFIPANHSDAAASGDHVVVGGDGDDVLIAGTGNDSLYGGKGDDLLIAGTGNDLLNGGEGNNTVSFENATAGVQVDLSIEGQQNTVGAGYDTLVSIQNLIGSAHDDLLIGNDVGNLLNGGLGNDTLIGGNGNDTLIGGMGDNTLTGGGGADTFLWQQGNSGHDTLTDFAPGNDTLDLSQLLQGHSAASLDDYLHFKVTGSGDDLLSTIEVSASAGATPTQTIDLQGVNLASQYGVAPGAGGAIASNDAATIINGMLGDHSLKVDTV